jgi:hypothetical protein
VTPLRAEILLHRDVRKFGDVKHFTPKHSARRQSSGRVAKVVEIVGDGIS